MKPVFSLTSKPNSENFLPQDYLRPSPEAFLALSKTAASIVSSISDPIILTGASWNYRQSILNWLSWIYLQQKLNYVVLCFDEKIHKYLVSTQQFHVPTSVLLYDIAKTTRDINETFGTTNSALMYWKAKCVGNNKAKIVHSKGGSTSAHQTLDCSKEAMYLVHKKLALYKSSTSKMFPFKIMMLSKFEAILHLLQEGRTVIWSDADSLLLRPCAYNSLLNSPPFLDIVGQRGLAPAAIAYQVGSTLCTGYFMVRPGPRSIQLMKLVKNQLHEDVFDFKRDGDDQQIVNEILLSHGGFSSSLANKYKYLYGIELDNRVVYTSPPYSQQIRLALLPYSLFPRGLPTFFENATLFYEDYSKFDEITIIRKRNQRIREQKKLAKKTIKYATTSGVHNDKLLTTIIDRTYMSNETETSINLLPGTPFLTSQEVESFFEWRNFSNKACIWHILSSKSGESKLSAMKRDGVLLVEDDSMGIMDTDKNSTEVYALTTNTTLDHNFYSKIHQLYYLMYTMNYHNVEVSVDYDYSNLHSQTYYENMVENYQRLANNEATILRASLFLLSSVLVLFYYFGIQLQKKKKKKVPSFTTKL